MSAYHAPSGAVYERSQNGMNWALDVVFVVLDDYYKAEDGRIWRRAFDLMRGELTGFGFGSGWDTTSIRIV